jgi:hypothetical protein
LNDSDFETLAKETHMEMISNSVEFVALLALAAWFGSPTLRAVWAPLKPRVEAEPSSAQPQAAVGRTEK